MKALFFTMILFSLSSCFFRPRVIVLSDSSLSHIVSRIEYVDQYNQKVVIGKLPEELILIFSAIPGRVFGPLTKKILFFGHIKDEKRFQLNLVQQIQDILKIVTPLNSSGEESIHITPSSTRFLRFGTFAYNPVARKPAGRVGFIDSESRDFLFLMYFDRPCRIEGIEYIGGRKLFYDIKIEQEGYQWVRVHKTGKDQYTLKHFIPTDEVLFSIMIHKTLYI